MAYSSTDRPDDGFATAAATITSLALASIATAIIGACLAQLSDARRALEHDRLEYALDSAHALAAEALLQSADAGRYHWTITVDGRAMDAVAEPEAAKLGYDAAAKLKDEQLKAFGASDLDALRARLQAAALLARGARPAAAGLDAAAHWQACAGAYLSPIGQGDAPLAPETSEPPQKQFSWRVGEVWRLRVASPEGWLDDRLFRFEGAPEAPVAVIARTVTRIRGRLPTCDIALSR